MKRSNDEVRTALREAADAIKAVCDSEWGPNWTNVRGEVVELAPLARRLRSLARRMSENIEVGAGASICPFTIQNLACWLGQVCRGPEVKDCPLSRGPIVVYRRKP